MIYFLVVAAIVGLIFALSKSGQGSATSAPVEGQHNRTAFSEGFGPAPQIDVARAWYPPGSSCVVAGRQLQGGLLYVGTGLPAVASFSDVEPALIDPTLPVQFDRLDWTGEEIGYWPSYSRISPNARGTYLNWLLTGRCEPRTHIGYVFIYFYGLERRAISDAPNDAAARAEVGLIAAECRRLLAIYGENRSFRGYASRLLSLLPYVAPEHFDADPLDGLDVERYGEVPLRVRVEIADRALAGKPIDSNLALEWFRGHPDSRLRTPARRCAAEFDELFRRRLESKFPKGWLVKPNKRGIKVDYTPASASFMGGVEFDLSHLPDVTSLVRPLRVLQEIADQAMADLDGLSRYLGKVRKEKDKKPDPLTVLGLLPAELQGSVHIDGTDNLLQRIAGRIGDEPRVHLNGSELLELLGKATDAPMSKKECVATCDALQRMNYAIEPDPLLPGQGLRSDRDVVLLRMPTADSEPRSEALDTHRLLMRLAVVVARADDVVAAEEREVIERQIETASGLTIGDKARLAGFVHWLLVEDRGTAGLKKKLKSLRPAAAERVAQFGVVVAGADGVIDPGEVKALRKMYRMLGIDEQRVYSDLNALQAAPSTGKLARSSSGPSRQDLGSGVEGRRDPAGAREAGPQTFALDMGRIEEKLKDTAVVAELLSEVFDEEGDETDLEPEREQAEAPVGGLGAGYIKLLDAMRGRSEISREDFVRLAASEELMPDGAIEVLNDAAFEIADAAVLHDGDPMEIDADVLEDMYA